MSNNLYEETNYAFLSIEDIESNQGYIMEKNIRTILKYKRKIGLVKELQNYLNTIEPKMIYFTKTFQAFTLPIGNF